jgi:hypothetical protein
MNKVATIMFFLIIGLTSCSSQKEIKGLPWKTDEVYYQNWVGGQELTGSGTNFYIRFNAPFPAKVFIKKVYFHGKEANFEQRGNLTFVAYFYQKPRNSELILEGKTSNEYGNKAPEIIKPKFDLKDNEAILEFEQDNKIHFYKISNIKEKELLAYPSARPRN